MINKLQYERPRRKREPIWHVILAGFICTLIFLGFIALIDYLDQRLGFYFFPHL